MTTKDLKTQIAKIASDLIKFKTVGDKEEIIKLFSYVKNLLDEKDYIVEIDTTPEFPVLLAMPKLSKPQVFICSHIDVVEGKPQQFNPVVKGKYIYGRGSYDMKTQAALSISLLMNTRLNVGLILTSDEESAKNYNGATYIASKIKNFAKLVIVPDGEASLGITYRVRGMGEYSIISKGIATRYSYPWRGENPYINLMKFYLDVGNLFVNANKASDKNLWYTTYNLISIDAKDGSRVPEVGKMNILVNCTTEYNRQSLLKDLNLFANKYNCIAEEVFFGSPYQVELNNKVLKLFKKELDIQAGFTTELLTMGAITDTRHFADQKIQTILCRIDGDDAHGLKERADLESAVKLYKAIEAFLGNNIF